MLHHTWHIWHSIFTITTIGPLFDTWHIQHSFFPITTIGPLFDSWHTRHSFFPSAQTRVLFDVGTFYTRLNLSEQRGTRIPNMIWFRGLYHVLSFWLNHIKYVAAIPFVHLCTFNWYMYMINQTVAIWNISMLLLTCCVKVSTMAPPEGHRLTAGDRNMDVLWEYLKFKIHRKSLSVPTTHLCVYSFWHFSRQARLPEVFMVCCRDINRCKISEMWFPGV